MFRGTTPGPCSTNFRHVSSERSGYITGYRLRNTPLSTISKRRMVKNYRRRLEKKGLGRFEILGLNADRELIRFLAERLSEDDADARRIRATVKSIVDIDSPKGGPPRFRGQFFVQGG